MLEIKNVTKKYNNEENYILKDISLSFFSGEVTAIIGESGSGKSTLMNILGGLDLNYYGEIKYNDKIINKKNIDYYRKNNVGFIFQSFNLLPNYTAYENVLLALKIKSFKNKSRIIDLFKKLNIYDVMNKKPNKLSGGQKQRVAIARSIINDPKIILADEPTGSLDEKNTKIVMNILKSLAKDNRIVIIVTHSKNVANMANRIIEIKNNNVNIKKEGKKVEKKEKKETKNEKKLLNIINLSLINFKKNIKRNLLITFAFSIGIFCLSFLLFLNNGIKKYIDKEINIKLNPKEIEVNKTSNTLSQNLFSEHDIKIINNINHVNKIKTSRTYTSSVSFILNDKKYDLLSLTSIDKINNKIIGNDNELVISMFMAKNINKDYKTLLNKEVSINILDEEKPFLFKKKIKITGILKNNDEILDNMNYAYINEKTLNNIYKENNEKLSKSSVNIYIDEIKNIGKVKNNLKSKGFSYSNSTKMIKQIYNYVDIISMVLIIISSISLFVSFIMIFIIMHINVIERIKEIGLFKSFGLTVLEIKKLFLYESGFIGLFAGCIGTLFSIMLSLLINNFTLEKYKSEFLFINIFNVFLPIIISIIISSIAGLKPAKKASNLDPIESLRYE